MNPLHSLPANVYALHDWGIIQIKRRKQVVHGADRYFCKVGQPARYCQRFTGEGSSEILTSTKQRCRCRAIARERSFQVSSPMGLQSFAASSAMDSRSGHLASVFPKIDIIFDGCWPDE